MYRSFYSKTIQVLKVLLVVNWDRTLIDRITIMSAISQAFERYEKSIMIKTMELEGCYWV